MRRGGGLNIGGTTPEEVGLKRLNNIKNGLNKKKYTPGRSRRSRKKADNDDVPKLTQLQIDAFFCGSMD